MNSFYKYLYITKFIVSRFFLFLFTILFVISINFFLIRSIPGEPLQNILGEQDYRYLKNNNPEVLQQISKEYGLDLPLHSQYISYIKRILSGNLGRSFRNNQDVIPIILKHLKLSILLVLPVVIISYIISIIIGLLIGFYDTSPISKFINSIFLFIYSVPTYCLGIIFLLLFSFYLGKFPSGGISSGMYKGFLSFKDIILHMFLPVSVMVLSRVSYNVQIIVSDVKNIKKQDFFITLHSKGLSDFRLIFIHILPNILIPITTISIMSIGFIASGSIVIERVFNIDGMGLLIYNSIVNKDYPMIQGVIIIITIFTIISNTMSDIVNMFIDPRTKGGYFEK